MNVNVLNQAHASMVRGVLQTVVSVPESSACSSLLCLLKLSLLPDTVVMINHRGIMVFARNATVLKNVSGP